MSVDLNRLTAHLSPQQQDDVKRAYHRGSEHSTTAFLYCFFLGTLGVHRFYLRQWRKGFAHLIVLVALVAVLVAGIALNWSPLIAIAVIIPLAIIALTWEIIDLFTIDHEVYEHNLKLVERLIGTSLLSDHTVERGADAKLASMMSGTQAQAAAAASHDQVVADAGSAATLAQESASVAQPVPALQPTAAEDVATERLDTLQAASAAFATDAYVATTTTQISGDDPAETQHATEQANSWSETEQYHAGDALSAGEAESTEEAEGDGGDLAAAGVTDSVATSDDYSLDQSLTRSHEASDYSVTDSAELMTTLAAADSRREDEQAVTEETPLTAQEAEAVTWPDHDPVASDEPSTDAASVASEAETTGGDGADDAALLGAGGVALAGAGLLYAETRTPSRGPDMTDGGQHPGSVESIADVEGADATPLYVTLPPQAPAEREYFDSTDRAVVADDMAGADSAGEPEDGLVVLVPEMDEPTAAMPALDDYSSETPPSAEPPAEAYIPPTVPVITSFDAAPSQSGTYRSVYDGTVDSASPALSAEPPEYGVTPDDAQEHSGGYETLAELAGGAALGAGAAAVYEGYAHHATPAEDEAVASTPEAAPAPEETAPAAAESLAPADAATPVQDSEPPAVTSPQPEAVLPDATAAAAAEQAATTTEEPAHHRMRHIRVVRQTVVGGEVIEETAAEEYIDEDADPEPVRARLQAMLQQQGGGRIADPSSPGGE